MGGGSYSSVRYMSDVTSKGYDRKSLHEVFTERQINNAMDPKDVEIRESRDSEEHPNSRAIILALDVTGSMGSIPHFLIKEGLPHIMDKVIEKGIKDPQILFTAIGDHECDDAPLQVAQFESSDELLLHWFEKVFIESGGGANAGESYLLAWYFAGYKTSIDCWEKRKEKGFLFTIGDEPTLPEIPKRIIEKIMGSGQYENFSAVQLLDKARETYHVFHLHLKQGSNGTRQDVMDGWKQLMGEGLIIVERREDVAKIIADKIIEVTGNPEVVKEKPIKEEKEEMML